MHASGAAHLRHAADALLHLFGGAEHEVGQLVDNDDDLRQRLPVGLVFLEGIVAGEVAHLRLGEEAVALEHLHDRPLQRAGRLLRVGHDGDEQVRDAVIDAELDHFRVDHDQAHLVRRRLIKQAQNERVHAHGLARAGRAGDEHMRQLGDVADDAVAADVLADGKRELGLRIAERGRVDDIAQANGADDLVRHLDADGRDLVRDRRDAHILHTERERKVAGEVRDLVELHARLELEIVARDRGAARHVADGRIDAEAAQGSVEPVAVEADLLRRVRLILLPRAQERHRRELIGRVVGILALDGGGDRGRLRRDGGAGRLFGRLRRVLDLLRDRGDAADIGRLLHGQRLDILRGIGRRGLFRAAGRLFDRDRIDRIVVRLRHGLLDRNVDEFFLGDRLVRHGTARTAPRLGQRLRFRFVLLILRKRHVFVRDVLCLAPCAHPGRDLADRQVHAAKHAEHERRHRQRQRRIDTDAGLEQIANAAGDHAAGRERLAPVIELADDRAERLRRERHAADHEVHDRAEQRRDQQRRRHAQTEVSLRIAHKDPRQQQHRKRERPKAPAHDAAQEARKAVDHDALGMKQAQERQQRQHDARQRIRPCRCRRRGGRSRLGSRLLFRRGGRLFCCRGGFFRRAGFLFG